MRETFSDKIMGIEVNKKVVWTFGQWKIIASEEEPDVLNNLWWRWEIREEYKNTKTSHNHGMLLGRNNHYPELEDVLAEWANSITRKSLDLLKKNILETS